MSAAKIRKGDKVVVLSGKDKGKTGEIVSASPKDSKVVVSGVNIATRHKKATQENPQGGLERREAPMHVSKVGHRPQGGKATRSVRDGRRQEGPRCCRWGEIDVKATKAEAAYVPSEQGLMIDRERDDGEFGYKNAIRAALDQIVLNMGVGERPYKKRLSRPR